MGEPPSMAQGSSASTHGNALPPAFAEASTGVPIGVLVVSRGSNGRTETQPLVLTYGLDRCETSSDGTIIATYTCRPRRLETIITTSGPRVRRLICQVWVTMHASYGVCQSASTSPPPIVWKGRVGDPCTGGLTRHEWVGEDMLRYEQHEVHRLLPDDQPIEILDSIDYETLLAGLRVAHRQDFEEELGAFGEHLVPRRPLQRLLFPGLSEKAYSFYLCHGSGAAVHVADLCKLLWWVGPWVAGGRVTEKLELLYTHLHAHHIPRLLLTHNPSPLLHSDHTLSPGACIVTASPTRPGALMLHIRESSECVKTTAVTPWFLLHSPSPGCTDCQGGKLEVVFVTGMEMAMHGVPPEFVGTCSATKEDLVRVLRDRHGCRVGENHGEDGLLQDGSYEAEVGVARTLEEAVGGQWPLRPLALLDEVICSSELRCKPHRHPYSARVTATESAVPPWRAVDEVRPKEMFADLSSAYEPVERGVRPYLQEGYEDDFDEEIKGGVLPSYMLCRRLPDDSSYITPPMHHENRRHTAHSTAPEKIWRLHLRRPCARARLGAPVIFPVMVKFQHSTVPSDFDYTSLRVRMHGDHYFQDVDATWVSSLTAPSTHGGAVSLLPLLAVEARIQHALVTELGGIEHQQRYDELWRRLPERVALSLVVKGEEGGDVLLDEAKFELNPLDFTGDLVRSSLCSSPDIVTDTHSSEPEQWTMVLVTSDAVRPSNDHERGIASKDVHTGIGSMDERATDSCGVPHACSAQCAGGDRGAAAIMDSVRAAFPSEGGRDGRKPEYFPDIGLTVVYAQGDDQKGVDVLKGGEGGVLVVVAAVIVEDDRLDAEPHRHKVTTAQRYGVEPLIVAVGSQDFVRQLEHGLNRPPGSVHWLQHTGLSAREGVADGEWRTWVDQDRNALAILHACRLAATPCRRNSGHQAAPDVEAPLQPETGPDEQVAPSPTSNTGWTGLTLKQVLRCLKEHPPARGVHQWPKPPTYERLRRVNVALEARMHDLTAIPSNEDWVLSFGAIVDELRNELRPLGPGIHDGYDYRGQQALTSLCADLYGAGVNLHNIVEAFDKAAVNDTSSTSSSSDDSGECTVDLTAAYERFKADQQRAINLHALGDYRQAFHTCVEAWVAGMMTLTAVIEDQPEAIQARWCIGQDVLVVMATAAASALEGGLPRVGWRVVWAGLDLALRPNHTLPAAHTKAPRNERGGAEHTSAGSGGGGPTGDGGGGGDGDHGGGEDRKACNGEERADAGAEYGSTRPAEDGDKDDVDTNPRSLSIHLGPSNPYVLPLIMVMAQILPALCHNTHPELSSDVALTILRAVLFAAERVSRPYDPLLAYMLEAVGAARFRVADDGGGRVWQLKEAAARLQAALHIREQHELRLARHQRQQQSSSLQSLTPSTTSEAFSRMSSSSSSSSGSSASPPPPPSSPPPPTPPPPSPQEQLLTLPPLLAVSIATAYVHLADYSLLYGRLLFQQRYRRAPLLRKQYAQAYLYTARRKLPKDLSSQHCVVRGIASGFYAIDCWEKGEGGGGCVCGGQNLFDDKPEWWSALDGGRSSCGLDHAEHTLVKRLLLWPGRYRGLTLVRLIKRGGEALVLEGRYNGQRCVAKLPFQRGSVDREMVIRRRLRDLEAGSDHSRDTGSGGGGGGGAEGGGGSRQRASTFLARVLKEFTEPWPCLVLKYESMDLLTILRTDTSRPISWVMNVLYQLSRALCSLHDHGVAHGDVAPRNVLIRDDGTVCMIDLGMAKVLDGILEGQVARGEDVVGIGRTMRRMLHACDRAASELRGLWEACIVEDHTQRPDLAEVMEALRGAMAGPLGRCNEPCVFALPKTEEDEARTRKIN